MAVVAAYVVGNGVEDGVCSVGGIIILCFLTSPVVGTIWYVQTMKEISSTIKEKRAERAADKPDVFDI